MTKRLEEFEADFQVGPTDQGMVRFIITTKDRVINLEFEPEEAREICEEIETSAVRAERGAK